jgi:hypothetical protein
VCIVVVVVAVAVVVVVVVVFVVDVVAVVVSLATASSGDIARPNSMGTFPGLPSVVPHRIGFAETGGAGGSRACPLH